MIRPLITIMFSLMATAAFSQSVISVEQPDGVGIETPVHPEYGVPVLEEIELDMNADDLDDVALLIDDNCDNSPCPWVILFGGAEGQFDAGYATSIDSTDWSGPKGLRDAIIADGITWGMLEGRIFPVNDIIGTGAARPGIPSAYEATLIAEQTPFGPQDPELYQVWRADILPDAGDEIVVIVPGGGSPLVGSPWFIIAGDLVAAYGWSLDWPRIYPDARGASVVSVTQSGFSTTRMK